MRRITISDITDNPKLKMLLYGEPGSYKTRLACSAALDERTSPVIMLNAAGNPISIRDYAVYPDIMSIDKLDDLNAPYEWLKSGQPVNHPFSRLIEFEGPGHEYKTVIIDQVTEVQRLSFKTVIGPAAQVGPGTIPAPAEIQHFNRVLGQMVTMAMLFMSLDMHVIIVSLERYDKDEVTGAFMHRPLLWGQSSSEMAGYAYAVARMVHRAKIDNRMQQTAQQQVQLGIAEDPITTTTSAVALFSPSGKYVAKDQYGCLGPYMVDPTITKIMDKIMAGPSQSK